MRIGYARVSTQDQNEQLQADALERAGCEKIYIDHASGSKADRPELAKALEQLRPGDTLVVWRLDRLGRSLKHLIEVVEDLQEKSVAFCSLTEGMDTSTPGGKMIFHIFGALGEFERDLIRERTNAGLQAARARGRVGGRKNKLTPAQVKTLLSMYESKQYTTRQIRETFGISQPTLYRYIREAKAEQRQE
ncbi:recombinase family protein [Desulfolithobacter sp.]